MLGKNGADIKTCHNDPVQMRGEEDQPWVAQRVQCPHQDQESGRMDG